MQGSPSGGYFIARVLLRATCESRSHRGGVIVQSIVFQILHIGINISPLVFRAVDLPELVEEGLDPKRRKSDIEV